MISQNSLSRQKQELLEELKIRKDQFRELGKRDLDQRIQLSSEIAALRIRLCGCTAGYFKADALRAVKEKLYYFSAWSTLSVAVRLPLFKPVSRSDGVRSGVLAAG